MAPCSVRWCGNSSQASSYLKDGITFHRFPKDPSMKEKWINETRRVNWSPSGYSVICSRHFTEDCFIYMKERRRLLSSAVPTLYLPLLSNPEDSNASMPSTSIDESLLNLNKPPFEFVSHTPIVKEENPSAPTPTSKHKTLFPSSSLNNVPVKRLYRRIDELSDRIIQKNKRIKNLRQRQLYMRKVIVSLKDKINALENQKLTDSTKEA